jgi:thioredoxin 1
MGNSVEITDANFDVEVKQSAIPVLVDFWAAWCNPCKMIMPMIERLAAEYSGKIKVGKIDIDVNSNTPSTFGVRSIPTLLFFKNGQMVEQIIGVVPEAQIKKTIEKVLAQ